MNVGVWVQLGLGAGMLVILYVGLARGKIWTDSAVQKMFALTQVIDKYKDDRIAKLEALVEKMDERNDLLSSNMDKVLDLARTQGLIEALPPQVAERIVK